MNGDDDSEARPKRGGATKRPTRVAPPKRGEDEPEGSAPAPRKRSRAGRGAAAKPADAAPPDEPAPDHAEPAATRDDAPRTNGRSVPPRERPRARRATAPEPSEPPKARESGEWSERPSARPRRPTPAEVAEARAARAADASAREGTHEATSGVVADTDEGAILVTGICGRLGRLVARELHRVERVIGVDRRPFPDRPKDIVFHELDLRRKKTRDIFRTGNVRAVVHLGILHDPRTSDRDRHTWNVVAFQKLLEYMAQYEVRKLVVLSSANVYGPQPDNPQFLTEEAPLLGSQEFGAIRDLVELDMLAQSYFWRHPESETVILRPCHIVGSVRNAPSNYLRLSRPITILGFDPMIQIIHERDVVRAILMALRPGVRGIFNLRGPGELPLSRILKRLGKRPTALPGPIARLTVDRLWRMRLASFPSPELDHVRYVCMVDDTRAREVLGFTPRFSIDETLAAVEPGS